MLFAILFLLLNSVQLFSADYPIEIGVVVASETTSERNCTDTATISEREFLFSEFALIDLLFSDETSSSFRVRSNHIKLGLSLKDMQLLCISDNKSKESLNSCYSSRIFPLLV